MTLARRLALAVLGAPFITMGYSGAVEPAGRVALAADLGIPSPEAAVRFNGAAMVAGGLGLVTGIMPRASALGLAVSLVPTTLAGHAFWKHDDPKARNLHRIQFLKNLSLLGGLLAVAVSADGRPTPSPPSTGSPSPR
jgi:putative oxidoreductase